jgi:hypothetical protein
VPAPPPEEPEETLLQYRVHKLKEQPGKSALVIAAMIAIAGIAFYAYPNALFGVISIAILMFSISFFLFPVKYRFTNKGVHMRNLVSMEYRGWDRFYDYFIYKDAVLLSFDYRTIRGRVQKGYLIYFDPERQNRDQLLEIVKAKIKKPEVPYTEKKAKKPATPPPPAETPEQK